MAATKQQPPHRNVAELLAETHRPRNALERLVSGAAARQSWTEQLRALVNPAVAPHCRVATIARRRLTIHVDNASWATRLRLELPKIEQSLRALEDFAAVDRISIRTA